MTQPVFEPRSSDYLDRVRDSFARQGAMQTLRSRLGKVEPGGADIEFDGARGLTQQDGFLHAGMVATALDSACGYAGLTLMAADAAVLTRSGARPKLPDGGARTQARPNHRGLRGRAFAHDGGNAKLGATMGCTLMAVTGRENVPE